MLCIYFEGRINKICQTEDEKKKNHTPLSPEKLGGCTFHTLRWRRLRKRKGLLPCLFSGDDENQEFISGDVKVQIPIRFPAGNVKSAIECVNLDSRGVV